MGKICIFVSNFMFSSKQKKPCTAGQKADLKAELVHCFNREVQLIIVDDSYMSVFQIEKKNVYLKPKLIPLKCFR